MGVIALQPNENVRLDRTQLEVLYRRLGSVGADKVVTHALEDLANLLNTMPGAYRAADMAALSQAGRALAAVAQQVGMTTLARVARDVAELAPGHNGAGLAAVMARLQRIGDQSLVAVWDLADLRV